MQLKASVRFALVLALCHTAAWAQPTVTLDQVDAPRRSALTVQPVELFSGTLNVEYEGAVLPFLTLTAGVNLLLFRGVFPATYQRAFGVGPELGVRFYPWREAPAGVWFGPSGGVSYLRRDSAGTVTERLGYSVGAMLGYSVIIDRFDASLGLGGSWFDTASHPPGSEQIGPTGFVPRLKVSMGFVF
jgi:hypothetical protein